VLLLSATDDHRVLYEIVTQQGLQLFSVDHNHSGGHHLSFLGA
jgi:hypothetical protein